MAISLGVYPIFRHTHIQNNCRLAENSMTTEWMRCSRSKRLDGTGVSKGGEVGEGCPKIGFRGVCWCRAGGFGDFGLKVGHWKWPGSSGMAKLQPEKWTNPLIFTTTYVTLCGFVWIKGNRYRKDEVQSNGFLSKRPILRQTHVPFDFGEALLAMLPEKSPSFGAEDFKFYIETVAWRRRGVSAALRCGFLCFERNISIKKWWFECWSVWMHEKG